MAEHKSIKAARGKQQMDKVPFLLVTVTQKSKPVKFRIEKKGQIEKTHNKARDKIYIFTRCYEIWEN